MHGMVRPSRVASPSSVRLKASVSRPVTEISTRVMMSATAAGSPSVDAGSAEGTAVVAVQPGTDVSLGIQRVVAERARRPPRRDHQFGVLGEITCLAEGQKDPQSVWPVLPVLQHDLLADLLLGQGKQFDDHLRALTIPGQ